MHILQRDPHKLRHRAISPLARRQRSACSGFPAVVALHEGHGRVVARVHEDVDQDELVDCQSGGVRAEGGNAADAAGAGDHGRRKRRDSCALVRAEDVFRVGDEADAGDAHDGGAGGGGGFGDVLHGEGGGEGGQDEGAVCFGCHCGGGIGI